MAVATMLLCAMDTLNNIPGGSIWNLVTNGLVAFEDVFESSKLTGISIFKKLATA